MKVSILDLASKIKELGIQVRPAVSSEQIKELEAQTGIKLPEDYVQFVTQIGDGWDKQVIKRSIWQEMKSVFSYEDLSLICEPFPYTDAWIWEDNETNPLPGESDEEWDKRVDELLRPKQFGNIFLMRGSNGEKFHLILNGECSGEIWIFTDIGVAPCSPRTTFFEWITARLEGKTKFI